MPRVPICFMPRLMGPIVLELRKCRQKLRRAPRQETLENENVVEGLDNMVGFFSVNATARFRRL